MATVDVDEVEIAVGIIVNSLETVFTVDLDAGVVSVALLNSFVFLLVAISSRPGAFPFPIAAIVGIVIVVALVKGGIATGFPGVDENEEGWLENGEELGGEYTFVDANFDTDWVWR